jgi:DNA-binding winged helix-turn-helix (wHTH) protein/TolB-like protein/Tfp pilus assembly protein PilF
MLLGTNNFTFGEFLLDIQEKVLLRRGKPLPITPKAFQLLFVLVEKHGHLVEKDELMKSVWADSFVEEGNITFTIGLLRKLLEDDTKNPRFIETVSRRGYRFIADVRRVERIEREAAEPEAEQTKISLPDNFPSPRLPVSRSRKTQGSGTVVALADWRADANGNGATERSPTSKASGESTEQTAGAESVAAKPSSEGRRVPKSRLTLAALALASVLIGAGTLGYYFFYAGKKASSADGKKSIAVLPLKPINTANRKEIYEIGIADSLIQKINSLTGFLARPLSATRRYTDIEQDSLAAGREQKVDYVLASNYQLAGGKIRITAQLLNVSSGQIEETYTIEKDSADVFAMQDAIAGEIGNKLLARFVSTSSGPAAKLGTTNEEAYRLYSQGRDLTYNRNAANTQKAIEYFRQAIELDPNFARAYSGMAHAYIASGNLSGGASIEYTKAKAAVTKALELDNNLAEGFAVWGEFEFSIEWDYPAGEKSLLRAIEIEPNSDLAHHLFASYLAARGRFDEALAESKIALEINPNSYNIQLDRARILYLARRYDETILQYKRIMEVHRDLGVYGGWLWVSYEMKGDEAGAYEWFLKQQKAVNPELVEIYQKAYETSGWQGIREKMFELQMINEQTRSKNYYGLARQCALLGKKELAFEFLDKAIENRQGQLQMLNVEPPFDILRDDPRFDELVRRVGLK